jgi:hypothetical protein
MNPAITASHNCIQLNDLIYQSHHTAYTRSKSRIPDGIGVMLPSEGLGAPSNHCTFPLTRKYKESLPKMHTMHQL